MRFFTAILISFVFSYAAGAQRVFTLDPEKDPVARRNPDGTLEVMVPFRALALSIQEAVPQITGISALYCQQIGRSQYLMAVGSDSRYPNQSFTAAILLSETSPGSFQTDSLIVTCSSTGECRECAITAGCTCTRGQGSCSQNSTFMNALKKITVTLFD